MVGIAVVGYGYWGPNLVRSFIETNDCQVVSVCDSKPERLAVVKKRHPFINCSTDYNDILNDSSINAVAIATPVSTHFSLAMQALKAGKHVLVEKPLTTTSEEANRLIEEANKRNLILMVDHTFIFTPAVRKIKELVVSGALGDLYYYDAVRINLGLFQHDVNVVWDLAVHDLAILDFLIESKPHSISAIGVSHIPGTTENIAYLTLFFENNLIGHIHVNWLAPVKLRRTLLGGSRKMIVYDDLEPSEKVKVYDKGVTLDSQPENVYQMLVGYRAGDMYAPQLEIKEALLGEADSFVQCILNNKQPANDGMAGLRVVEILEAASESLIHKGSPIELDKKRVLV